MAVRIAINGFGRIGRLVFRHVIARGGNVDVVGINDLTDAPTLAHLLKYDSVHGKVQGTVEVDGNDLIVNGNRVTITFTAADAAGILTKAEYSINAAEWVFLEPSTRLSDSREHSYSVTVDRPAGELTIAVRVTDEFENHSVDKTVVK